MLLAKIYNNNSLSSVGGKEGNRKTAIKMKDPMESAEKGKLVNSIEVTEAQTLANYWNPLNSIQDLKMGKY